MVTWTHCSHGTRWILREVELPHKEAEVLSDPYQISPTHQPEFCLDVLVGDKVHETAVLAKCREISTTDSVDPQVMFLEVEAGARDLNNESTNEVIVWVCDFSPHDISSHGTFSLHSDPNHSPN